MELPEVLFGSYADVARAARKIYKLVKAGQDLSSACGNLIPIDTRSGHVVVTGPDRLSRGQALFRPHLLHDVASSRTGGRELQTWLVDPLLQLEWGGLCVVSQETKAICDDIARARALLAWALRWFDVLEAAGPIFGADRLYPRRPTFCRTPSTLLMVVAAGGVSTDEIRDASFSSSDEMRKLFERAAANLSAKLPN